LYDKSINGITSKQSTFIGKHLRNRKEAKLTANMTAKNNSQRAANNAALKNARMAGNNSPLAAQLRRAEAQLARLGQQPSEADLATELRKVQRFDAMMKKASRKGGRRNRKTRRN
jgi:hypothetical protein